MNKMQAKNKMQKIGILLLLCSGLLWPAVSANAQGPGDPAVTAVWRDPGKPTAVRVAALMSQLTPKEKISLLYWLAPAIDRLGIPAYDHGNECLHGLVRPGKFTVFPEAIGLGATFDPPLIHQMTTAISDEARAKWNMTGGQHLGWASDVLTCWSPVVNMARDPRWGRTQETYGEDPWLTSRLGVAFVTGLQGNDRHYLKVISTPKHFAGNNQETGRGGLNIRADERYLQEFELAGFRACIMEGKAQSVMAAYTAINGVPSSANKWLLTDVLRGQWGFDGYAVSDCGAVSNVTAEHHYVATPEEAIAACLNAGLNLEGGGFSKYPDEVNNYLPAALDKGLVTQKVVDTALARVLTGRFKLGMYDPPAQVPYSKIPPSVIGSPEHIALARKMADESLVLLKNRRSAGTALLPINPSRVKTIAVVGPYADNAQFGDYSGSATINPITPLAGIQARAKASGITVQTLPWLSGNSDVVPASVLAAAGDSKAAGLTGEYFQTPDLSGAAVKRVDPQLNFDWSHAQPDPLALGKTFSVRWTGSLKTTVAGAYLFSLKADGGYRLFVDEKPVIDRWNDKSANRFETKASLVLETPGVHTLRTEYNHQGGDTGFAFSWSTPIAPDYYAPLKNADLVVAVIGLNTGLESEGQDRETLALPQDQEAFIQAVAVQNPRTVVVLEGGSAIAMPWAETIPSILLAWYPGEEGGDAIADALFGDYNPAGRLPLTFYASDSQLRPMDEYDLTKGRTYLYFGGKPLYPFGHGLSYTTFQYGKMTLSKARATTDDHVAVSVAVTNTGTRDGEEVVQCYVHARKASVPMPIKQLWAFQRIFIPKGRTKMAVLKLDTKNFGHWDKRLQRFLVEPGSFDVLVGSSSADIRQTGLLRIR